MPVSPDQDLILALDQGTSSSRALLFTADGTLIAQHGVPFALDYPQPGWVQVDGRVLWETQRQAIAGVLADAGVEAGRIAAIGLTNQRETVLAWDAASGEPLTPAIVWQCRRTTDACAALRARGVEDALRARTGLLADPYFSATKMAWLLEHTPGLRARAMRGDVRFGTVDAWLVWQLSGGAAHVTDASNASRTLLCNLATGAWDPWLTGLFEVPASSLPRIVDSSGVVAHTDPAVFAGARVPIAGMAGDQQAALFGQACFQPGMAKNTYGTGCFLLVNAGDTPPISRSGLLGTIAWRLGGRLTYALEGSVFVAGALIQWLRDGLGVLQDAAESESLARSVDDNGGVVIVPALAGLGAPHWRPEARGMISGLTRGSTRAHIARAALEAVALQNADLLDCVMADGIPLAELRIDGGMTANDLLCQIQADVLDRPVARTAQRECSAFGAALLAGLGIGLWPDLAAVAALWRSGRRFEPGSDPVAREQLQRQWRDALARTLLAR